VFAGSLSIATGTRWFRDGVSERAGDILGEELFPDRFCPSSAGYGQLAQVREKILDWSNCQNAPDYYQASAALILEAENAAGQQAVSHVMDYLAGEPAPGGRYLRRAFERGTGIRLPDYLKDYSVPWIGAAFVDSNPDKVNPPLVGPGNQVMVVFVSAASPASRRGLQPGDVIESVDGVRPTSADHAGHLIAKHKPGEMVEMRVRRNGETSVMRLKLTSPPPLRLPVPTAGAARRH
jgi:predicted metalloprotease with PDZ domain